MVSIIDFRSSTVEKQMHAADTTCGFAVFTNVFDSITLLWRLMMFQDFRFLTEKRMARILFSTTSGSYLN